MLRLHLGPAAEGSSTVNVFMAGKRPANFMQDFLVARTKVVLGDDLLACGAYRKVEIGLAILRVPRLSTTLSTTATGGAASMLSEG